MRRAIAAVAVTAAVASIGTACSSSSHPDPAKLGVRSLTIAGHAALQDGFGPRAVVMAHGATTHKEQWLPLMPTLARAGYDVVALDLGDDRAAAVQDAVAYVKQHGASTIVLMGSSAGAGDVLAAAASGRYAAVVTFSAVSVRTTDEPVLAIASKDESSPAMTVAPQIVHGSGKGSTVHVVEGNVHGADMVKQHPEVGAYVVSWLATTLGR
jgi:pimeloyl-ACP methyl ester carboxylesterase